MAEKTGYVTLNNFCKCIIHLFGREYLRKPDATDIARLYSAHEEKHGFKGMLGSIDYGIYPDWTTLIKGYSTSIDEPRKKFTKFQASARNDVERTFGVLQGRFAILKTPARVMSVNKMRRIMYSCIVMHNMIQEDNGFALSTWEQEWLDKPENRPRRNIRRRVKDRRSRDKEIRDRDVHDQLREDLTAHIWNLLPNFRSMQN
ncbi:uncharacterized protein [Rutidosis leptorrhynchoides]|uniref:uncharacterized protein n=1 Tax=Rutidosis leptorrhynchoides TaxID=125765 RepID=UPI003A9A1724